MLFKSENLEIKSFPISEYSEILKKMEDFTCEKINNKNNNQINNIWLLEHYPVYTQGKNGKPEHILRKNNIPVIQTSRGGQVTYHGPGQLMVYFLLDLKKHKLGPKDLVHTIENIVIKLLDKYNIKSNSRVDAPGIYVNNKKICSIGLRIKQGQTYHGIALNVNMDLAPFNDINPCGYDKLKMCQISDFINNINIDNINIEQVKQDLLPLLKEKF